ncbi:hypothetical protein TNCV_4195781 [Trichonephila clavipes]|nr:hypothetical protein TNCV_4195781 [Trichonephila clavipes]
MYTEPVASSSAENWCSIPESLLSQLATDLGKGVHLYGLPSRLLSRLKASASKLSCKIPPECLLLEGMLYIACMRSKSSSFETTGRGSRARRRTIK